MLLTIPMLVIIGIGIFAFVYIDGMSNHNLVAIEREYKEYSTPESAAAKWHDSDLIGTCSECGMDDLPIVHEDAYTLYGFPSSKAYCKWCYELIQLNYHLKTHGVRRLEDLRR